MDFEAGANYVLEEIEKLVKFNRWAAQDLYELIEQLKKQTMKEIFIGTAKACLYMGTLIGVYWTLNGFKTLAQIDIVGILAIGAIVGHFVDKEEQKK